MCTEPSHRRTQSVEFSSARLPYRQVTISDVLAGYDQSRYPRVNNAHPPTLPPPNRNCHWILKIRMPKVANSELNPSLRHLFLGDAEGIHLIKMGISLEQAQKCDSIDTLTYPAKP